MKGFGGLLSRGSTERPARRERWSLDMRDVAVYAVGDVHGCLDELLALEAEIVADAGKLPGEKLIVMLGDYVDRGPSSAQVIDHLLAPPPEGLHRVCLAGNHETMMLGYLEGRIARDDWIRLGGDRTLLSYGIDTVRLASIAGDDGARCDAMIREIVPEAHADFLKGLAVLVESPAYVFVHAGIWPDLPLGEQSDEELTTMRGGFFAKAHLLDRFVVHGHTPVTRPQPEGKRVNVDTGAYFSGRLTALRIWRDTGRFLSNKPFGA